jgi:hypothetical protein
MEIFRALFELGKARQDVAGLFVEVVVDFKQNSPVGLDDEWVLWVDGHGNSFGRERGNDNAGGGRNQGRVWERCGGV